MTLFTIGRMCVKIAGRDAGGKCVVVESIDNHFVLVDGDVRRKKVNIQHLEPINMVLEISKGAAHGQIQKLFESKGWKTWETKAKKVTAKPRKQKKKHTAVSPALDLKATKGTLKGKKEVTKIKKEEAVAAST